MSTHDPLQPTETRAPGHFPAGPQGPGGRPAKRTNGQAIAALILGVAGFTLIAIPLAVIFGIVALVRIKKTGQSGTVLAAMGVVLALLWATGIGVVAKSALDAPPEPERDAQGRITQPADAGLDALRAGDCVKQVAEGEAVNQVKTLPCNSPGAAKVYAVFSLPQGAWPGEAAVQQRAEKGCTTRFKTSKQQAADTAEISFFQPAEVQWRLGNRKVICMVQPAA